MVRPEVEVSVLGPVQIRGAARPFARAAARELVVYLALHPHGARTAVWAEALWPTRAVSPATMHSTASDARRSLGRSSSGVEHLPRGGRRLQLGDAVGTDVERFTRLASGGEPHHAMEALGLIRGALFDGLSLADWAVFDGTQARVESMVAETALQAARACMSLGRGADAEWMIRQALRISSYDERLYRALLRATDAQGNRTGLRATMAELLSKAADPAGPPLGGAATRAGPAIHPRTVALYRELAHGAATAAGRSSYRL
jgi:DNA-binding SARP family transcriptional activator